MFFATPRPKPPRHDDNASDLPPPPAAYDTEPDRERTDWYSVLRWLVLGAAIAVIGVTVWWVKAKH